MRDKADSSHVCILELCTYGVCGHNIARRLSLPAVVDLQGNISGPFATSINDRL